MSSRKSDGTKSRSKRKKLKLSKETLKDLTTNEKGIKGGVAKTNYEGCSF